MIPDGRPGVSANSRDRVRSGYNDGASAGMAKEERAELGSDWPRGVESNHQLTLRRGRLYPFNYGELLSSRHDEGRAGADRDSNIGARGDAVNHLIPDFSLRHLR